MTQTEYETRKQSAGKSSRNSTAKAHTLCERQTPLPLIQARSTTNRPFDGQLFKDGDVQWSEKAKDTLVTLTFTSLTLTQQEI